MAFCNRKITTFILKSLYYGRIWNYQFGQINSNISLKNYLFYVPSIKYSVDKKDSNFFQPTVVPVELQKSKINVRNVTSKILNNSISYMEEISHLDEVRNAQSKVIEYKDKLKESGDEKRRILFELNSIRQDIQKNHNEIASSMRGTERYVTLVKEEMNLLNNENKKQSEFNTADELERQLFNSLTAAINDSYEKEKVHSNFIKILGLIGTLTASIVTLIASAIGHFYHNTKFGLVAKDFKENVNKTIKNEVSVLQDNIRLEIQSASKKQERMLKQMLEMQQIKNKDEIKKRESLTEFIRRYSYNIYCYFVPRKNT